jgi:serine/threonine protein phosphatase PrpC
MTEAVAPTSGPLLAAYRSDPGRVRINNEDLPLVDAARGVYGVIDGVGGSAAGEVAAAIARDVILHRLSRPLGTPGERVREAIAIANNEIFRRSERAAELRGMTCVVTLSIVTGERLTIGHVGDSRLYTMTPHGLGKLTHDHSPVGEREDAREISEIEAMHHPRRHELFRDVGGALHDKDEDDFVEVIEAEWGPECALLLCTDGLTDMVPSATIERIVRQHAGRPEQVVDALVDAANEAGGHDNVTVVYAEGAAFAAWARGGAAAGLGGEAAGGVEQEGQARPITARCGGTGSARRAAARCVRAMGGPQPDDVVRPRRPCRGAGDARARVERRRPSRDSAAPYAHRRRIDSWRLSAGHRRTRGGAARRHRASRTRGVRGAYCRT